MSKIALIILAAVVALIIIVVLTGMRYLRADDEGLDADDAGVLEDTGSFEDTGGFGLGLDGSEQRHDRAGARQRSGRSAAASGRSQGTSRNRAEAGQPSRGETGHRTDGDHRTERGPRQRSGQGAGRPDRAEAGERGRDDAGRRGRDEVGRTEREHGSRAGRERGDTGDLVAVPGLAGQGGNTRSAGRPSASGADRRRRPGRDVVDLADEPDFTDGGGSRARRLDREDGSARVASRQGGDGRTGRSSDRPEADWAGSDRSRAGRAGTVRGDGRRSPVPAVVDSGPLPEIRPRTGRGKKDAGDWPSGEWEQLSDADYWAELAADRPRTDSAGPASGRADAARAGRGRANGGHADAARGDGARGDGARGIGDRRDGRLDAAAREIPSRERVSRPRQDEVGYGTVVGGYGASRADYDRIDAADRTISMPASRIGRSDGPPAPAPATRRPERVQPGSDDDPLTSPSFPRITADDGRSYRRSRSDSPSRQAAATAGYPEPGYPGPGYPGPGYPEAEPLGWPDHPSWPSAGSAGPPAARPGDVRPGDVRPGDVRPEPVWSDPARRGDGRARSDRVAADRGGWTSQPGHAHGEGGHHGVGVPGPGQHDDGRFSGQYAGSPGGGAGYREAAAYPAGGGQAVPYPSGGYGPAAPAAVAYSAGDSGGYGTGYSGPGPYSGSAYSGSGHPAVGYYAAPSDEGADTTGGYGPSSYGAGSQDAGLYGEPHYADVPYDQDPGYPGAAPFARDERAGYDPYTAGPYGHPGYGS